MSLVLFKDDGGGTGMAVAVFVEEGDLAGMEAYTAMMGLEAIFLEVSSSVA
jgi:hypothetical protein